jgi:hypothetical protein
VKRSLRYCQQHVAVLPATCCGTASNMSRYCQQHVGCGELMVVALGPLCMPMSFRQFCILSYKRKPHREVPVLTKLRNCLSCTC